MVPVNTGRHLALDLSTPNRNPPLEMYIPDWKILVRTRQAKAKNAAPFSS